MQDLVSTDRRSTTGMTTEVNAQSERGEKLADARVECGRHFGSKKERFCDALCSASGAATLALPEADSG
jgi:hypothetical protein